MDRRFWAIIGVIIVLFAGFLVFNKKEDTSSGDAAKATSHVKGKTDSKVTLVEYGDFQCAFCGQYYPLVEQVVDKYKDKIAFRFANLPIIQAHPNAYAAARAAEAAANQDKYWEMHAQLFQNQQTWSPLSDARSTFAAYANQLGLDMKKYNTDVKSSAINDRIRADRAEFNKTGLKVSTPTFILNGKHIEARSVDEFSKLIDAQLKKNGIEPPAATPAPAATEETQQ